jgi:cholesterol oxidase
MSANYDAIVVGSGFGGAVAACRLAQAGQKVLIVERGRRYKGEQYPVDGKNPRQWLWETTGGLFDIRALGGMTIVQSAAYGGGSQIYANVHLRPPADLFASGWPSGLDRTTLDPYYDLVAHMLDVKPITSSSRMPTKSLWMKQVARKLGRENDFFYPNLAVHFGDERENRFGAPQKGCSMCGRCDVGCPEAAKNTLDLNYLFVAEKLGAQVEVGAEVFKLEPGQGGGYQVSFRERDGGNVRSASAKSVFLCAGAVNTTELLLRCRDQHASLPRLSERLGEGYSGNGDYLAFGVGTKFDLDPAGGPTITTAIRYDRRKQNGSWFLLQEGGYPHLGLVLEAARLHHQTTTDVGLEECTKVIAGLLFDQRHTTVLLAMGRDRADGRVVLEPGTRRLAVHWNTEANLPLYDDEERLAADVVGALEGTLVRNPLWQFLRRPVSVHSLGGCPMGADATRGVIDAEGQVFNYPGLFVMDGAALPTATGVNPSSTIAAVAERNVERYIRSLGKPAWEAPERADARPVYDPLDALPAPVTRPPETPTVGVRFTETMTGFFTPGERPSPGFDRREYEAAEKAGRAAGRKLEFTLTITMPNLHDPHDPILHAGVARGRVIAEPFTAATGAEVRDGVFQLFVAPESARLRGSPQVERRMIYALPFVGQDGKHYLLDGVKIVRDDADRRFDLWTTTTTLYTVVREGHMASGPIVGTGIVRIPVSYLARQLTTMRVIGTGGVRLKLEGARTFAALFFGNLWDVFVTPRLRPAVKVKEA